MILSDNPARFVRMETNNSSEVRRFSLSGRDPRGAKILSGPGWKVIACNGVGLSGLGDPVVCEYADGSFECRMGVSLFGSVMSSDGDPEDPFDEEYVDNYAAGKGATVEDAYQAMAADANKMAEGLWD